VDGATFRRHEKKFTGFGKDFDRKGREENRESTQKAR
jgi:hypothetical protein